MRRDAGGELLARAEELARHRDQESNKIRQLQEAIESWRRAADQVNAEKHLVKYERDLAEAVGRLVKAEADLAVLRIGDADRPELHATRARRDHARGEVDRLKAEIKQQEQLENVQRNAVRDQVRQEIREEVRDTVRDAVRN